MGLEANCTARWKGQSSAGKAHLEEKDFVFRGSFRLKIALKDITSAEAKRGALTVKFAEGTATFDLGPQAEKWALKIRYPRSRIEKLGVKPGMKVRVLGVKDESFAAELRSRVAEIHAKPAKDSDVIFFAAEDKPALAKLKSLEKSLKRSGALWVVYPKGQKHITQLDVMAAAKSAGLVDVKVVSFSETHTALKLMIPLARR
jgi:hypothetical protein